MFKRLAPFFISLVFLVLPLSSSANVNDAFKGWAWNGGGQVSGASNGNAGWLSVNCTNTFATPACTGLGFNYGVDVNASKNITGWAWMGSTTASGQAAMGWVCFGSTCPGDPPGAPSSSWSTYDDSVSPPQLRGWARIYSMTTAGANEGWISLNCSNTAVCGTSNYHVDVDLVSGSLSGYAWNRANQSGNYYSGIGWVRFDPNYGAGSSTTVVRGVVPWLQARYGDIYSKGNISSPTPFTSVFAKQNATFCIDKGTAGTIVNFTQGACGVGSSGNLNTDLNLPKSSSNYTTTLGRIDLAGIQAGKYGTYTNIATLTTTDLPTTLGGGIYNYVAGAGNNLTARTINNAIGTNSGAGLLIVRGNLNITGDILYQNAAITKLKQLASFGIMVLDDGTGTKGNVTISSNVQTIAANIYAEGTVTTGTTGSVSTDVPLAVYGVVLAKKINFQRLYTGSASSPAEQIIYDGRLVANTPPGMSDFVSALPKIFEGTAQ